MPFDSLTFIEASRRPLAAHHPAFEIGTDPPATDRLKARPVPRWHSSLHAERVGSTLNVLLRARELIGDEQRWCRRTYARGWRGLPVPVQSSAAPRFCAGGALLPAGREPGLSVEAARHAPEGRSA